MPDATFLRDLGIVLFLGFLGAWLASRGGQSVIVGYLLIGIVVGPRALGIIEDARIIGALAEVGIVLLLFFLGLEFSLERLRRVRTAVLMIGAGELLANLAVGFLAGSLLGWGMIERAFLAGIVAMSSSGVVAKLLIEWRRTANPEAEVLMGIMIFEDFIAVLYLSVLSSLSAEGARASPVLLSLAKAGALYALILGLGGRVGLHLLALTLRLRSDELFVLLWLALIVLAAVGAAHVGVAPAAGAFLLGMITPARESDLGERIYTRLEPFRDVFLALFFLAFGMMLEPASARRVLPLLLLIVPLSLLTELVITSSLAFLVGFPSSIAIAIGAGMIPRGEYALLYAAFGHQLGLIGSDLFQFTGWYVVAMTLVAPAFMKNVRALHRMSRRLVPAPVALAGTLISATLQPATMGTPHAIERSRGDPGRAFARHERALVVAGAIAYLGLFGGMFAISAPLARAGLLLGGSMLIAILMRTWARGLSRLAPHVDRARLSALLTPGSAAGFEGRTDGDRSKSLEELVSSAIRYTTHALAIVLFALLLIAALWESMGVRALGLLPLGMLLLIGRAWRLSRRLAFD